MKYEAIEKRYGKKLAKKIVEKMSGQTVGVNEDRSLDYYGWDIQKAVREIKAGKNTEVWD